MPDGSSANAVVPIISGVTRTVPRTLYGSGAEISAMSITSVSPSQYRLLGPTAKWSVPRVTRVAGRSVIAQAEPARGPVSETLIAQWFSGRPRPLSL